MRISDWSADVCSSDLPRVVKGRGWRIEADDLLAACDGRTRALYVSQVTSLTGQRVDVAALSAALAGSGTMLIVDSSHALGVVPVDGRLADVTVSAGYKFLCATQMGKIGSASCRERVCQYV